MPKRDSDRAVVAQLAREMQRMQLRGPFPVLIMAMDAYVLTACLQLAWRHPQLSPAQRRVIEDFARQIGSLFDDCPTAADTIRRGWDPGEDR